MWYAYVIGYGYAVVAGLLIKFVVDSMWKCIKWKGTDDTDVRPNTWQPVLTGIIERILYVTSLIINQAEFIGIWLALKVAGQWKRWGEDPDIKDGRKIGSREIYQNFLIGSGLSIIYAVVGYKMVGWIPNRLYIATILPLCLIISTFILNILLKLCVLKKK